MAQVERVEKSDAEWREELGSERFEVLRQKGTERAFTGALLHNHDDGTYVCAGCGAPLFDSGTKFDSGSGWPSFWEPATDERVALHEDRAYGMRRTEVTCAACGGHLGHVFDDGPAPTGQRYCINSLSLAFEPAAGAPGEPDG